MAVKQSFPDKTPSVKLGLADSSELTAKEIEVLPALYAKVLNISEIAVTNMHISQRTVKFIFLTFLFKNRLCQ